MYTLSDMPPSLVDSLLLDDVPNFLNETNRGDEIANAASGDCCASQGSEGNFPLGKVNSLVEDVMGDDGDCAHGASDLDDFSELMWASLEPAAFSVLEKASSTCAPPPLPLDKALPPVKSAEFRPVFRIPVASQVRAAPLPIARHAFTVPSVPTLGSSSSAANSVGVKRKFVPEEVGDVLVARVAPVVSALTMVPLSPVVPSLAPAAAQSGAKKVSKYPLRQEAAKRRSRKNGKFQKEENGFRPAPPVQNM